MNDTVVYKLSDTAGKPLYVGMSRRLDARLAAHRCRPWSPLVSTVETSGPMSRIDAFFLERRTIWECRPRFNRTWQRGQYAADLVVEYAAIRMLGLCNHTSWARQILDGFGVHSVAERDHLRFYRYDDVENLARRLLAAEVSA